MEPNDPARVLEALAFVLLVLDNSQLVTLIKKIIEDGSESSKFAKKMMGLENVSASSINSPKDILKLIPGRNLQNSNITLDGKSFEVAVSQCENSYSKSYLYENAGKTYALTMGTASIKHGDKFSEAAQQNFPILDQTAATLRIQ